MRDADRIGELDFADVKTKPAEIRLAKQVLGAFTTDANLRNFTDHYEEALRGLIAKKRAVDVPTEESPGATRANVVDLADALRQSLAEAKALKGRRSVRARVLMHKPRARRKAS
jgi:non-homologous end joining protein Ku